MVMPQICDAHRAGLPRYMSNGDWIPNLMHVGGHLVPLTEIKESLLNHLGRVLRLGYINLQANGIALIP